ncbi:hypothetical protein KEM55_001131, partial [Ascosphaera atra]
MSPPVGPSDPSYYSHYSGGPSTPMRLDSPRPQSGVSARDSALKRSMSDAMSVSTSTPPPPAATLPPIRDLEAGRPL